MFKTKHTLHGTMMKTGPVRDAQKTKQGVYNIPRDCGRCYISETSRHLEVCTEEHKYNIEEHKYKMTQSLLEKNQN
jgi:phosphopentomutase